VTVKGCEVFSYVGNAKNVGHSDANSVFDKTHGRARSKNRASKSRFIELIGKRKKLYFDKLLKISVSSSGPTFALASLIACWLQFLQIVKSIGFINNTSF
jgi:hypothetical protein